MSGLRSALIFCDDSNLDWSIFKYVLSTMGWARNPSANFK